MSSSNTTCYYNDGRVATENYFCGLPNKDTCCGSGWECLSNGLCQYSGTTEYAPSSCTDPSYKNCLLLCNDVLPGKFTIVRRCEPAGNSWCFACNLQKSDDPDCCDTNLTTSLEPYPFTVGTPFQPMVDSSSSSTSIYSITELALTPSTSSYLGPSLESTIKAFMETSTSTTITPSGDSTSSPSTRPKNQSHNSKMDIEIGITVAVVVILLAILAFFVFQNRNFKQRLLELREGPSAQKESRATVRRDKEKPPGELDITHYELTQQNAPQHELSGNEIHEIYHRGIPEHNLNRDYSER